MPHNLVPPAKTPFFSKTKRVGVRARHRETPSTPYIEDQHEVRSLHKHNLEHPWTAYDHIH